MQVIGTNIIKKSILLIIGLFIVFVLPIVITSFVFSNIESEILHKFEFRFIWIIYAIVRFIIIIIFAFFIGKNFKSLFLIFILPLLLLEGLLTILPLSTSSPTFTAINWSVVYYKPVNKFGFRDKQTNNRTNEQTNVYFLGDSFTAGLGLKHVKYRFDYVCFSKLKTNQYSSINLGIPGIGAYEELENLKTYGTNAQIVVYQYYVNDIESSVIKMGKEEILPLNRNEIKKILSNPFIRSSYLVNYLYWKFPQLWLNSERFIEYNKIISEDEAILNYHLTEVQQIIDYCEKNCIRLIALVFPELGNFNNGKDALDILVSNYLIERDIKTIEVRSLVQHLKRKERVVNAQDAHASKKVHKIVGFELSKIINNN